MLSVRPKVAELAFQLYGRSLHPELFKVHQTRTIQRGGYEARIDITTAGHVVTWRYEGLTLTEVAASAHHPLPQRRRLLSYRLRGQRQDRIDCRGGVQYSMRFELEAVSPECFWNYHEKLSHGLGPDCLFHPFASSGRMAMGAVSYVHSHVRSRMLKLRWLHTFPDDCAIVKCESTFQLP